MIAGRITQPHSEGCLQRLELAMEGSAKNVERGQTERKRGSPRDLL